MENAEGGLLWQSVQNILFYFLFCVKNLQKFELALLIPFVLLHSLKIMHLVPSDKSLFLVPPLFWDSPGWPWGHELLVSASHVLGLQICTNTPSYVLYINCYLFLNFLCASWNRIPWCENLPYRVGLRDISVGLFFLVTPQCCAIYRIHTFMIKTF
jgi:hypothetical protein